jgi:cytochrome c oxidase assembly protein subunit 15
MQHRSSRPVAIWLFVGVFMIMVQVILGGITRLTGSGLSITEWQPILGTIPPVNEQQWQHAFDGYKQIAQYKNLNAYFTLADFKFIYFWEWLHRLWGRLISVVFLIPFIVFLVQRRFRPEMVRPMIVLFLLGGLQGLIGWIMVKSGLNDENLYVSPIRLAIHFITALVLLVYTYWFALNVLLRKKTFVYHPSLKAFTNAIITLLLVQLIYGAFMAGLKAAPYAPTWPSINGAFIPDGMSDFHGEPMPWYRSIISDPITVHFIHRNLAYLITGLVIFWTFFSMRIKESSLFAGIRWLPLFWVLLQVGLGIGAVLTSPKAVPHGWGVFEWFAQLHQLVAILLLLSLVLAVFLNRRSYKMVKRGPVVEPHVI